MNLLSLLVTPPANTSNYSSIDEFDDICMILCCLICPPIAVAMAMGCGKHVCINLLMCLLGFVPGVLHAIYVVARVGGFKGFSLDIQVNRDRNRSSLGK